MNTSRLSALAAMVLCSALLGQAEAADSIKVNGRTIPQSRIDAMVKAQVAQGQAETPELHKRIRDELINREILSQEAVKKGIDKQPDVAAQLDFGRQGVLSGAFLRDYIRTHPVTDELLKQEYERLKPKQPAKEYKAHHILVEKEDDAKGIISDIKNGASFEKLAGDKSKDQGSKAKGGDLGWSPAERYVKPFGDALTKLKKGQMTESPVQSQFGWHVIRLDDERAAKMPDFEEAKPRLQQIVQTQLIQKAIADLRAKAKIE